MYYQNVKCQCPDPIYTKFKVNYCFPQNLFCISSKRKIKRFISFLKFETSCLKSVYCAEIAINFLFVFVFFLFKLKAIFIHLLLKDKHKSVKKILFSSPTKPNVDEKCWEKKSGQFFFFLLENSFVHINKIFFCKEKATCNKWSNVSLL